MTCSKNMNLGSQGYAPYGLTIIKVEHNLNFAAHYVDKMYHVANGGGHFCSPQDYVAEYVANNAGGGENA